MKRLENSFLLLLIIIIEGYVILSSELLAIRLTIPFVGSGTDTVSVIIAAVLLPLALGYRAGGKFKSGLTEGGQYLTIRKKLLKNLLVASCFLLPALSYAVLFFFFLGLDEAGFDNKLLQVTLYCALFIIVPIYLLGQTIPLVSNYFSKEKLSQITGRMLFFSTVGSFLGAVFSTLVLMQHIGAHHTASLIFVLLTTLTFVLSKKKTADIVIISAAITIFALLLNSDMLMTELKIVKNNKYNTMQVYEDEIGRHLIMNNNDSSLYNEQRRKHTYVEFTENVALKPILNSPTPKEILIVGAGAFTFGHEDKKNHYTFVDVDGDLLEVAEKYILKEKVDGHKEFVVMDIRPYLHITKKKYDVIFLDAYLGGLSIPENLVTQEFFQQIKGAMNDGGVLVTNFIVSPNFNNTFSKNLDNTLRSVFPHISRHIIQQDKYDMWKDDYGYAANVAYIYRHEKDYEMGGILADPPDIDIEQKKSGTQ